MQELCAKASLVVTLGSHEIGFANADDIRDRPGEKDQICVSPYLSIKTIDTTRNTAARGGACASGCTISLRRTLHLQQQQEAWQGQGDDAFRHYFHTCQADDASGLRGGRVTTFVPDSCS